MVMVLNRAMSFLTKLLSSTVTPSSSSIFLARSFNTEASPLKSVGDVMLEIPLIQGVRRGWFGNEDDYCLYFRMDMPGLGEKHVKVNMKKMTNTLCIEGEIKVTVLGDEEDDKEAVMRNTKSSLKSHPISSR